MAKKRRKKKGNGGSQPEELDEKSKNFIYLLVVIGVLLLGVFIALEVAN